MQKCHGCVEVGGGVSIAPEVGIAIGGSRVRIEVGVKVGVELSVPVGVVKSWG